MQANNGTRDEGQQEVDAADESATMKAINELHKHPPNCTDAQVTFHPVRGAPPMHRTTSPQDVQRARANDNMTQAVAKPS